MSVEEHRFDQGVIALQERLGYRFRDKELLVRALTHRSYANESSEYNVGDNERMEFLGDAVVELLVSETLFRRFDKMTEGQLSRARAAVVRANSLAECAALIGLGDIIRLGRGERDTGGKRKESLLADALEAVVGAAYLDGGLPAAAIVVENALADQLLQPASVLTLQNPKNKLQEWLQERGFETPSYEDVSNKGTDQAPCFVVEVRSGNRSLAQGEASSKREASLDAARIALLVLKQEGIAALRDGEGS